MLNSFSPSFLRMLPKEYCLIKVVNKIKRLTITSTSVVACENNPGDRDGPRNSMQTCIKRSFSCIVFTVELNEFQITNHDCRERCQTRNPAGNDEGAVQFQVFELVNNVAESKSRDVSGHSVVCRDMHVSLVVYYLIVTENIESLNIIFLGLLKFDSLMMISVALLA
jgi:hypothetical protein